MENKHTGALYKSNKPYRKDTFVLDLNPVTTLKNVFDCPCGQGKITENNVISKDEVIDTEVTVECQNCRNSFNLVYESKDEWSLVIKN